MKRCPIVLLPLLVFSVMAGAESPSRTRPVVEDPIHIVEGGTSVTTPVATVLLAEVHVQVHVANQSEQPAGVALRVRLIAPDGIVAARTTSDEQPLAAGTGGRLEVTLRLHGPYRWGLSHPELYRAVVELLANGKPRDTDSVEFGIRELRFDAATGLWLNGKSVKLNGVFLQDAAGPFGSAVPAEIYSERLLALKALGVNAVRVTHDPPPPKFLALCDKLGLLVMDASFAAWHVQETKDLILLDRTNRSQAGGLERESWWSAKPVVHMVRRAESTPKSPAFADWTPESLAPHDEHVEVYSNCKTVTLSLNGTTLASKLRNADDSPRTWTVPFAPGTLRAVCGNSTKTQETWTTAGKPDHILLVPSAARVGSTFDDVASIRAIVVDAAGNRVPRASQKLHFSVTGPGSIVAVDNGASFIQEPFQAIVHSAFDGTAVAYVRGSSQTGLIRIKVSADGLKSGGVVLQSEK